MCKCGKNVNVLGKVENEAENIRNVLLIICCFPFGHVEVDGTLTAVWH